VQKCKESTTILSQKGVVGIIFQKNQAEAFYLSCELCKAVAQVRVVEERSQ
jgi:hypothetical protein